MIKKLIFIIFVCYAFPVLGQNRNSVWCFGDSALIDFGDTSNLIIGTCGFDTRGSCASISNQSGELLCYANTRAGFGTFTTLVFDTSDNIMQNGDLIMGEGWYNELIIIPNPAEDSTYYLFSIGVAGVYGLSYSIIDMKLNNNLGAVTSKNNLLQSFPMVDCLNAVKHGNGRDWWIIFRRDPSFVASDEFLTYLVTPNSVSNYTVQNAGGYIYSNNGDIVFAPSGNKFLSMNPAGLVEIMNFDRCTGIITLDKHIEDNVLVPPSHNLWHAAFSSDESKLYITASDTTTYLYQYDLNAPNIAASKDTLWTLNYPQYAGGGLKLAPDNKIYLALGYYNGLQFPYPYQDSVYNMYNMNLSVINQPDSTGIACDFLPYSFYLGGKRTYLGLPNNPNYELGPLSGSFCDSLTAISEIPLFSEEAELFVYFEPTWQTAFINANKLKGKQYNLEVFDLLGHSIFRENGKISPPYFTKNINCEIFSQGMYLVNLVTDKERLSRKFIIQ